MDLLFAALAVVGGLVGLVFGADRFVVGSSTLATNLGVSPLIVGMVIIGLGTSAPEMLVSTMAALDDQPGIAVGNALGSNMANIGLVLGVATLIKPIELGPEIARNEMPILAAVTAIAALLLVDGHLGRTDGLILIGALALVILRMLRRHRLPNVGPADDEPDGEGPDPDMSSGLATLWLLVGLALMVGASRAIVWGASSIASAFGVSDLVIGLTVVAIGTSLPELAASVTSALKGHHEMAVGNVIGSNTFNLLAVLPLPGLLAPSVVAPEVVYRDLPVVGALTLLFWATTFSFGGQARMGRVAGFALLACYVAYMTYVGMDAAGAL